MRKNKHNANKRIKQLYFAQKNRGTEGYGFLNINTLQCFRAKYEHQILSLLAKNKASEILFHHRRPTSTDNTPETAHPIYSGNNFINKYYLVHNGTISNDQQLYDKHTKLGLKYSTFIGKDKYGIPIFNDSECLLLELGLYLEGKQEKLETIGSVAFVLLETDKNNTPLNLYYGRNYASDLKFLDTDTEMIISSEGNGNYIDVNELNIYCYKTKEFSKKKLEFKRTSYLYYEKNYSYNKNYDNINLTNEKDDSSPIEHKTDIQTESDFLQELTDEELQEYKQDAEGQIEVATMSLLKTNDRNEGDRLQEEKREAQEFLNEINKEIKRRSENKKKLLC